MRVSENRHLSMVELAPGKAPLETETVRLPPALLAEPNPRFTETDAPGIYTLFAAARPDQPLARYAVNLDARESDLQAIEPDTLPPSVQWRTPSETTGAIFGQPPTEISLETPLLLAALVLLLVELTLAWWMGRGWG